MDDARFDKLARALAGRLPRRRFPALAAALAAGLGVADSASAERRIPRHRHDDDRGGETTPLAAGTKKPKSCAPAGASCKQPKKGKAPRCCPGLACDGATKRCGCAPGATPCRGGCLPDGTECCGAGAKPCAGGCVSEDACCDADFATCFAPHAAAWADALGACDAACAGEDEVGCAACLDDALRALAGPFAFCFDRTCAAPGSGRARAGSSAAGRPRPNCNTLDLERCQVAQLAGEMAVEAALGGGLGLLKVPAHAAGLLAAAAVGAGSPLFDTCNSQFGCAKGFFCDKLAGSGGEGFCCRDCSRYDPRRRACVPQCGKDEECRFGDCAKRHCKTCLDYAEGNALPCGTFADNCGRAITCRCPGGQACESAPPRVYGLCAATCPRGAVARAGGCCVPKTCAELGKACGDHDDGCGGIAVCGSCADADRPLAFCDEAAGACRCFPAPDCGSGCVPVPDGCGGMADCDLCAGPNQPKGFCAADGRCACEPDTCASLGKTCGSWPNGCGLGIDCGPTCGAAGLCCAQGQTCCLAGDGACCDAGCEYWPGGSVKGCCPAARACPTDGLGGTECCPEGQDCRGPNHPISNCCITAGLPYPETGSRLCCSSQPDCSSGSCVCA